MSGVRWAIVLLLVVVGAPKAEAACTLSATAVAFGTYDVFQVGPSDSTGTITYRCGNSDHDIRIAISTGTSGNFGSGSSPSITVPPTARW